MKTPENMDDETTTKIAKECDEVTAGLQPVLKELAKGKTALGVAMGLTRLAAEITYHYDKASTDDFRKVAGAAMRRVRQIHDDPDEESA